MTTKCSSVLMSWLMTEFRCGIQQIFEAGLKGNAIEEKEDNHELFKL